MALFPRVLAIDFETANCERESACALGLATLEGRVVTHRRAFLIRPRRAWFDPFCVAIHGITEEMVEDAPEFPEVWEEIRGEFAGAVLLAHNASFDMGVLAASLAGYGLSRPECAFLCTRSIGRRAWPGLPSYSLGALAARLAIRFRHHDASEDAHACALLAAEAARAHGADHVMGLAEILGIDPGRLAPGDYAPCRARPRRRSTRSPDPVSTGSSGRAAHSVHPAS